MRTDIFLRLCCKAFLTPAVTVSLVLSWSLSHTHTPYLSLFLNLFLSFNAKKPRKRSFWHAYLILLNLHCWGRSSLLHSIRYLMARSRTALHISHDCTEGLQFSLIIWVWNKDVLYIWGYSIFEGIWGILAWIIYSDFVSFVLVPFCRPGLPWYESTFCSLPIRMKHWLVGNHHRFENGLVWVPVECGLY